MPAELRSWVGGGRVSVGGFVRLMDSVLDGRRRGLEGG